MTDQANANDDLYYAIKALPGWYQLLRGVEELPNSRVRLPAGSIISSIILAVGEGTPLVAVAGKLDDAWSGHLVAVFERHIVVVVATTLADDGSRFTVRVLPVTAATDLTFESSHNFYDGVGKLGRHKNFAFAFKLGEETYRMQGATSMFMPATETEDAAVYKAFGIIRDAQS